MNELKEYAENMMKCHDSIEIPKYENGVHDSYVDIKLKPLDFYTSVAIANTISANVVTDFGEYYPELTDILLLFNILKESAGIEFEDFDKVTMYSLLNSKVGSQINELYKSECSWISKLHALTMDKIEHRKSVYCNPNNIVNHKISALIDKELDVQNALLDSTKYMEDLSKDFTAEDLATYMNKINEFTELLKNPELSERFLAIVQNNAQDERILEADRIIGARNVLSDTRN